MMQAETIQISGEPTFTRTYPIPPISVRLPLEARTRVSLHLLHALFSLTVGALSLATLVVMIWMVTVRPSIWIFWIYAVVGSPVFLLVSVLGLGTAWICLKDVVRSDPVLIVRANEIEDRRARATIPWTSVSHARIAPQGRLSALNHVHLTLRQPIEARHNPFRPGTMGYPWRRRPDTLRVPLIMMDVKPFILAKVVAALVERHGGEVTVIGVSIRLN